MKLNTIGGYQLLHTVNDYLKFLWSAIRIAAPIYEYLMNIAIYQLSNGNVGQVPKLIMYGIRTHSERTSARESRSFYIIVCVCTIL